MTNKNESLGQENGFFVWKPACWLRVSGTDSLSFLQGQFTNDLREFGPTGVRYGLWLNHKGRVLADSFIVCQGDNFWVGSYHSTAATIRERLEPYIIADDVIIDDLTPGWVGITDLASGAGFSGGGFPDTAVNFSGRRGLPAAKEWLIPLAELATARAAFSGRPELGVTEMEQLRIAARIPAIPADIGPGELPGEGALDGDAVSYTKGCYLGQEVMARLKSMGQVRRRLLPIHGRGTLPIPPTPLFQGERKVGELRSVVTSSGGFVGLALVTLLHFRPDERLSVLANGEKLIEVDPSP